MEKLLIEYFKYERLNNPLKYSTRVVRKLAKMDQRLAYNYQKAMHKYEIVTKRKSL